MCPGTGTEIAGNPETNVCEPNCPHPNQYIDPVDKIWKYCDSSCETCLVNEFNCQTCTGDRFLSGSDCVTLCPVPKYGKIETHKCEDDCIDSKFKHDVDRLCYTVCPAPYYGNEMNKMCEDPCPDGFYKDATTNRCKFCFFNCLKCNGGYTACTSCKYDWLTGATCIEPSCETVLLFLN